MSSPRIHSHHAILFPDWLDFIPNALLGTYATVSHGHTPHPLYPTLPSLPSLPPPPVVAHRRTRPSWASLGGLTCACPSCTPCRGRGEWRRRRRRGPGWTSSSETRGSACAHWHTRTQAGRQAGMHTNAYTFAHRHAHSCTLAHTVARRMAGPADGSTQLSACMLA